MIPLITLYLRFKPGSSNILCVLIFNLLFLNANLLHYVAYNQWPVSHVCSLQERCERNITFSYICCLVVTQTHTHTYMWTQAVIK